MHRPHHDELGHGHCQYRERLRQWQTTADGIITMELLQIKMKPTSIKIHLGGAANDDWRKQSWVGAIVIADKRNVVAIARYTARFITQA
jgi:hypothetical protein